MNDPPRPPPSTRWLRWPVAFVWLATGLGALHPEYRRLGEAALAPLGLPPWVMLATCAGEVLVGLRVALGPMATWLAALQVLLIVGFTLILTASQPDLWVHPFGPLTKNVPILALVVLAWRAEREPHQPDAPARGDSR